MAAPSGALLGREPVMTVSTAVALLIAVLPVFGWSTETVGTVAAALVLVGGAVEAALVSVDRMLPLLVGVAKAVLAAVAAFGVHVPDNYVAALMAVLTVVAGLATRAQVGAVQPPRDRDGRSLDDRGMTVGDYVAATDYTEPESGPDTAPGVSSAHTEVFGAVAADGPVPAEKGGQHRRDEKPGGLRPIRSFWGELDTELGT